MLTKLMPRRIPDYPDAYTGWNTVSSFGSLISVVATVFFGYIIFDIFANQSKCYNNPWFVLPYFTKDSTEDIQNIHPSNTLEWTLSSPIPLHPFLHLPLTA
jgi:heme/copper-type cytochrome/quinol oxidase subunit 1